MRSLEELRNELDRIDPQIIQPVSYTHLECWGGATFDASLRFLKEDPWDRLRKFRDGFKHTKLQMLFRGQNILGYRPYADDVVEYFVEKSVANGIDIIRIFDCLNDLRNLQTAVSAANKEKAEAQVALSYTLGDAYTLDYWVDIAKRIEDMGANSICIKDMAGLLLPYQATCLLYTSFTADAGYCYVGALQRDSRTFIVALLACGWPNHKTYKWQDTSCLLYTSYIAILGMIFPDIHCLLAGKLHNDIGWCFACDFFFNPRWNNIKVNAAFCKEFPASWGCRGKDIVHADNPVSYTHLDVYKRQNMIRGLDTTVKRLRHQVFTEVANLGFNVNPDTLNDDMEAIPYKMVNEDTPRYRENIYRARSIVRERLRLAMGLSLRPEDKPVHLTAGVEASNISEKYYEPPLMQVKMCIRDRMMKVLH